MKYHVEFAGTPGSGKSSLVGPLLSYLDDAGIVGFRTSNASRLAMLRSMNIPWADHIVNLVPNRLLGSVIDPLVDCTGRRASYYQQFFCSYTELGQVIPAAIERKLNSLEDKAIYLNWFYELISEYQAAVEFLGPTEALVIDEGFVNRTMTLFCSREDLGDEQPDRIKEYLSNAPRPDVLVVPNVPINICERRIRKGNRSFPYGVDESSQKEVLDYLSERAECISIARRYLEDTSTRVVAVDNSGTLSETVSDLHGELNEAL